MLRIAVFILAALMAVASPAKADIPPLDLPERKVVQKKPPVNEERVKKAAPDKKEKKQKKKKKKARQQTEESAGVGSISNWFKGLFR